MKNNRIISISDKCIQCNEYKFFDENGNPIVEITDITEDLSCEISVNNMFLIHFDCTLYYNNEKYEVKKGDVVIRFYEWIHKYINGHKSTNPYKPIIIVRDINFFNFLLENMENQNKDKTNSCEDDLNFKDPSGI